MVRDHVQQLLQEWQRAGKPSREDYLKGARWLERQRSQSQYKGLWPQPPLMITATVDDGWGHGLDVMEALAMAVGITIDRLGVLQSPATILKACRERHPDLLGLTVLQFDSDDALKEIATSLPETITLVAGGAAFRYDPDFARRTATRVVARNGASFLQFLLTFQPQTYPREDIA